MRAREILYQVTAPHFCAGLSVRAGRVVDAAPILSWTRGKSFSQLRRYFRRHRWRLKEVAR